MTRVRPQAISSLVVATHNPGKLREFESLLQKTGWQVSGLMDSPIRIEWEETGTTFEENARLKALACSRETALPVLADDSGLEVEGLGGRPGIHSARYAGEDATDAERCKKLFSELQELSGSRRARFVCALAVARHGVVIAESRGECGGVILDRPRGRDGFGYDPVFFVPELGRTFAELTDSEKNRISHRAQAVESLLARLLPE